MTPFYGGYRFRIDSWSLPFSARFLPGDGINLIPGLLVSFVIVRERMPLG